jgi:putative NADH-flavin reductase
VVTGDVLNAADVKKSIFEHDVVICTLGAGAKGNVRAEGTKNIIQAMRQHGVKRLICQSSLGVGESRGNLNFFWKYIMFGLLLKKAYRDHELQESVVIDSKLDWTITRPAAFTDGPRTGKYQYGFGADAKGISLKISRADVADLIIKQLTEDKYVRKAVGQSY